MSRDRTRCSRMNSTWGGLRELWLADQNVEQDASCTTMCCMHALPVDVMLQGWAVGTGQMKITWRWLLTWAMVRPFTSMSCSTNFGVAPATPNKIPQCSCQRLAQLYTQILPDHPQCSRTSRCRPVYLHDSLRLPVLSGAQHFQRFSRDFLYKEKAG